MESLPSDFSRAFRALKRTNRSFWFAWGLLTTVLVIAWSAWFFLARVMVYATSEVARIEVDRSIHPMEASVAGRVVEARMRVGQEVEAGEILLRLDDSVEQLQLAEMKAHSTAVTAQLDRMQQEKTSLEKLLEQRSQGSKATVNESQERRKEAEAQWRLARDEYERLNRLQQSGLVPDSDLEKARIRAEAAKASLDTFVAGASRTRWAERADGSEQQVRAQKLAREIADITGQAETLSNSVARLTEEVNKRCLRAPVTGKLGEVIEFRVGSYVALGAKIAVVVPEGQLRVVAEFTPDVAVGRIQPGQTATVRLAGFPWWEYGTLSAKVERVGSEVRDGRIRVELAIFDTKTSIPLQHGMPGVAEVAVERVTPVTLVLRVAGRKLSDGSTPSQPRP